MIKKLRIALGLCLAGCGVVFFILPGSILFLLGGLLLLSMDFPTARHWLRKSQRALSVGAARADAFIARRR